MNPYKEAFSDLDKPVLNEKDCQKHFQGFRLPADQIEFLEQYRNKSEVVRRAIDAFREKGGFEDE